MGKQKDKNEISILEGKHYQKSNALVNSKGKASLIAQKLFAIGIQQAEPEEKTGLLVAELKGTDLRKIFNKTNGSFYDQIKDAVTPVNDRQSLLDYRVVFTDDTTKKVEAINVITDCTFEDGILTMRFNNKVNNQIHELKANYTVFSLAETMPLKHIYSFKLYEILKAEYDRQDYIAEKYNKKSNDNPTYIMEIDLIDLKLRLGIIDANANDDILKAVKKTNPDYEDIEKRASVQDDFKKYSDFAAFRRAALDKPQKELREKTSIQFEYVPIKCGRGGKTTGIRFFISKNNSDSDVSIEKEPVNITISEDEKMESIFSIKMLLGSEFSIADARVLAEKANYDVKKVTDAIDLMNDSESEIKNVVAWLLKAIENNYQPPKSKKHSPSFFKFQQNTEDIDEKLFLDN